MNYPHEIIWDEEQQRILHSEPNCIISGVAGSGKTLLACHLAIKYCNQNKLVAIVVYTKALKIYIQTYLESYNIRNCQVYYLAEYKMQMTKTFDIVIIDEYQDFSKVWLLSTVKHSKGIYIFGDDEQSIYKEASTNKKMLLELTGFNSYSLKYNRRTPHNSRMFVANLTDAIFDKMVTDKDKREELGNYIDSLIVDPDPNFVPECHRFPNIEKEVTWIEDFLKVSSEIFQSIGILCRRNIEVEDLVDFLTNKIEFGYKHDDDTELDFNKKINILTIHSAKGLEFDLVILPFMSELNIIREENKNELYYVAATRFSQKLIITFSKNKFGHVHRNFDSLFKKGHAFSKIEIHS